jgi:hypothetical protein
MRIIKNALIAICVFTILWIGLMVINVLQNGSGKLDGRSIESILGVPAAKATVQDIRKLSKSDVMQLYLAAPAPKFEEMKGEYKAELVPVGIGYPAFKLYSHYLLVSGDWKGKAFYPFARDKGWGYNLGEIHKDGKSAILRDVKMDTFIGKSRLDEKISFQLDYSPYNRLVNYFMDDEVRKINDNLYICMGFTLLSGHWLNPIPFVLYERSPWIGPDKKE